MTQFLIALITISLIGTVFTHMPNLLKTVVIYTALVFLIIDNGNITVFGGIVSDHYIEKQKRLETK